MCRRDYLQCLSGLFFVFRCVLPYLCQKRLPIEIVLQPGNGLDCHDEHRYEAEDEGSGNHKSYFKRNHQGIRRVGFCRRFLSAAGIDCSNLLIGKKRQGKACSEEETTDGKAPCLYFIQNILTSAV